MPSPRMAALLSGASLPALSLDFAGTGVLDGRITFTRASTATFVGSDGLIQTASSGQARFGYDPVTLAALGYLSEEARTNLILQSNLQSGWTGNSATLTAAQSLGPDGLTSLTKITATSTSLALAKAVGVTINGTSVYAVSGYMSAGTSTWIRFGISDFGANTFGSYFNLSGAGTVGSSDLSGTGTLTTATIKPVGNGIYYVSIVGSFPGSLAGVLFTGPVDANGSGNVTIGRTAFAGFTQIEFTTTNYPGPTSYIPTTTATVTRAADVLSMTGSNFSSWYNQSAGTFVTQATPSSFNTTGHVFLASDGTNHHFVTRSDSSLSTPGKRLVASTTASGSVQARIATAVDSSATQKSSYAYATNDFAFSVDSVLLGSDSVGTLPTPTTFYIGNFNGIQQYNGHIASIKYYNQRLSNAQLQALTT